LFYPVPFVVPGFSLDDNILWINLGFGIIKRAIRVSDYMEAK
jgi:hypothetical protein